MRRKTLSKRQKDYRVYLESDHWKALRDAAIARDGCCVRCRSVEILQVHHLKYRNPLESCTLADVTTLCRKCHRQEHGIGPTDFQSLAFGMERLFNHQKRPPVSDWLELKSLMTTQDDVLNFGELMFKYIMYVLAHEREKTPDWWLNKSRRDHWFRRAFNVRTSIYDRTIP